MLSVLAILLVVAGGLIGPRHEQASARALISVAARSTTRDGPGAAARMAPEFFPNLSRGRRQHWGGSQRTLTSLTNRFNPAAMSARRLSMTSVACTTSLVNRRPASSGTRISSSARSVVT